MLARQLLATKFQPPPLRPGRVIRTRLVETLQQGYAAGSRLSLICAPAGYGKTTLAIEWVQQGKQFGWLSLDESDNDPQRYFTSLLVALQKFDPGLGNGTSSLLSVSPPPAVEVVVGELINEISAVEGELMLVIDDYQHIHTQAIHDAMESLLAYQPANLHLVITSREDPPFPLGRLRAGGQLTEIRLRDLRFSAAEVQAFLQGVHHLDLPPAALEKLLAVTEGWAAGLQLTGMAFRSEQDAESFFDTFSGTHHYIITYLMEEVLRRQPEATRRFLTNTSILDRFNAQLCEAVNSEQSTVDSEEQSITQSYNCQLSTVDCQLLLDHLERSNLFLTPLDPAREWFRYHRLFADVLRSELDPQTEAALHLRAARWFDAHDLPGEAIPHYLAANATQDAGRLVRALSAGLVKNGELQTLLRWLQSLPPDEVRADPQLVASHALALLLTGNVTQAIAMLDNTLPGAREKPGSGALLAVKAWLGLVCGGNDGLRDLALRALAELPPEGTIFRALALLSLGTGYQVTENLSASCEAFQEAYTLGMKMQHPFAALAGFTNLAFNLYDMGQLRKARALCLDAMPRYTDSRGKPLPLQGMVAIPLAAIYLEQNDLVQARKYAQLGRDMCQKLFSSGMMGGDAEVVLASVAYLEGSREEAFAIAGDMYRFAVEHRIAFLEDKMTALEADLHLRDGDFHAVRGCLARFDVRERTVMATVPHFIAIIEAHVLYGDGRPNEGLAALAPVEADLRRVGRIRTLISLLAIKVAMLHRLGRHDEALDNLAECIRLAAPEDYYRALLRFGAEYAGLLPEVRDIAPVFVDELLAALAPANVVSPSVLAGPSAKPPAPKVRAIPQGNSTLPRTSATLAEPLSEQERNVLRLLAAGRSNQEIADQLFISPGTAKWHVHNILSKLGAASRSQAAAMARELGLL